MQNNLKESVAEKRKFVRLNTACDVSYSVLDVKPREVDRSQTRNISAGGICLIVNEELKPGSILGLDFVLGDKKTIIQAKGRIAWIKPFKIATEQERFDCGIEFTEISSADREKINQYIFSLK